MLTHVGWIAEANEARSYAVAIPKFFVPSKMAFLEDGGSGVDPQEQLELTENGCGFLDHFTRSDQWVRCFAACGSLLLIAKPLSQTS